MSHTKSLGRAQFWYVTENVDQQKLFWYQVALVSCILLNIEKYIEPTVCS